MAKKTVSVYLQEDMHTRAMANRVTPKFDGNFSSYAAALIEDDLAGTPDVTAKQPIVALAKMFNPTLAKSLEQQLLVGHEKTPVEQGRVIALFLEALHHALKRNFNPEATFQLWASEEVLVKSFAANPALLEFVLKGQPDPTRKVNEDPEKYEAPPSSPAAEELKKELARRERQAKEAARNAKPGRTPSTRRHGAD